MNMNKKKTVVLSDSTSDLSPELIEEYGVAISPLTVVLGDESHLDGIDITPDDVYDYYKSCGKLAKTTAGCACPHRSHPTRIVPR